MHKAALRHEAAVRLRLEAPLAVALAVALVLVHAECGRHAEKAVEAFHGGGLVHAEERAALIDKAQQFLHERRVLPGVAAAPRAAGKARVDHDVHVLERAVLHVLKAEERDVERQAGERLVHVNKIVAERFVEVAGERPGAELAPAVQHGHARFRAPRRARLVIGADGAEFIGDPGDAVHEIREALREVHVAAQADAVHRRAQQGAAHADPVLLCVARRVAALHEGGRAAQAHGEEIGVQAELVGVHVRAGAQPRLIAGEHALDEAVKAEFAEPAVVGLHAHPAVVIEYVRLLAILVHDIDEPAAEGDDEIVHESHPVLLLRRGGHVGDVQAALVDEILRRERVAIPLLKQAQRTRADGEIIGSPVGEQVAAALVRAPDPHEIVEQRGEAHHRGGGVALTPAAHPGKQIRLRFRVDGVDLHEMLLVPVVRGVVVHGDLFPDAVGEEAHGVGVERDGAADLHRALLRAVGPAFRREQPVFRAVIHLPVGHGVPVAVDAELLGEKVLHEPDGERVPARRHGLRHQKGLLQRVRMGGRPLVVVADQAHGGIDAVACVENFIGKGGAVAVADDVRAPFSGQLQREGFVTGFARHGESPGVVHGEKPPPGIAFFYVTAFYRKKRSFFTKKQLQFQPFAGVSSSAPFRASFFWKKS